MTNIDVRPSHRWAFDCVFFIDIEGHIEETRVRRAINDLTEHCVSVKGLGAYRGAERHSSHSKREPRAGTPGARESCGGSGHSVVEKTPSSAGRLPI
jgi:hypothetical protein